MLWTVSLIVAALALVGATFLFAMQWVLGGVQHDSLGLITQVLMAVATAAFFLRFAQGFGTRRVSSTQLAPTKTR